ncbi:MAG: DUF2269 family protein [Alicyclobacillaceae bacterium]|nr:DUF2269 family protein [Alicyclobacillaceae bacterium]
MTAFYILLAFHLGAVAVKLAVLFYVPRLKDVRQIRAFLGTYRRLDWITDWVLWLTGAGFFFVTSWEYLLQLWLLVSMLIYLLIFIMIKKVVIGGMQRIAQTKKLHAYEEVSRLRFENLCTGVAVAGLLGMIAYLMITKPF